MKKFITEAISEAKKLQTPSKKEVYFSTSLVLAALILTSIAILISDYIISKTISLIFGL